MKSSETQSIHEEHFDPKSIFFAPRAGKPVATRNPQALQESATQLGYDLQQTSDGFMAYTEYRNDFPSKVHVWDDAGRLSRVDFIGTVRGNFDQTGELAGKEFGPVFSNVYTYDEQGRLIRDEQIQTQNDFNEHVFRGTSYSYQPDGSYDFVYTSPDGRTTEGAVDAQGSPVPIYITASGERASGPTY